MKLSVHRRQKRAGQAPIAGSLVALALILASPPMAIAELAPPSAPPALAKRKCVKYAVLHAASGPRARCVAYRTEVIRRRSASIGAQQHSRSGPAASGSAASGRGRPVAVRAVTPPRSPQRFSSLKAADRRGAGAGAPGRSQAGGSAGAVLAVIAAAAVAVAGLIALMRKPLLRRGDGHVGETGS